MDKYTREVVEMKSTLRDCNIKSLVLFVIIGLWLVLPLTANADQVGGLLGELRVVPNGWYVRFDNNYDRCGANGKFVRRNSNDIQKLADAVMSGRQVQFEFHCGNGVHIVDSWKWRSD